LSADTPGPVAAVPGLTRSDPHGPGITRERASDGFHYRDFSGAQVASSQELLRIGALGIPPAWKDVWISPDPLGHIQATGVDSRGRTQYRYHQVWREQRDAQKFEHMLRFAGALPALRSATIKDLGGRHLDHDRVTAAAVRLIDLGLFRIGGEKYAELDHHYGATTLRKSDVKVTRTGVTFDYIAKEGKRRTVTVTDDAVLAVTPLARGQRVHRHPRRWSFHRQGIPHLERHSPDGAASRERGPGAELAGPKAHDHRRRPQRGGLAG
jgi:DNA topoisomerase-1